LEIKNNENPFYNSINTITFVPLINNIKMNIPTNLKYTKDHEWVAIDGEIATVGITDFAQKELGDSLE
jgi:hypothetical protein